MSKANSTLYDGEAETVAEARKYTQANGLPDPYRAYASHKNTAKIRGIAWGLTFASWWGIWQPYFHMRGRGTNFLCMARERDEGGYEQGNVYLTTNLGNLRDYHKKSTRAAEARKVAKEKKEMAFARRGSKYAGSRDDLSSHLVYKSKNTSKSTCNHKDDSVPLELSLG